MNNKQVERFRKRLKNELKESRYEHSLNVSFICMALAMCYGIDLEKAKLAGILHDCAKCYSNEELIEKCQRHNIFLTDEERLAPSVIHAIYGAWMAEHEYGITDSEILEAIRCHTTGKPEMSALDMIVYIADYIEPGREEEPGLSRIRRLAFQNLEQAMYEALACSLKYLEEMEMPIDSRTQEAYAYYFNMNKHLKGDADESKGNG